jgi:hypothetical protein
LTTLHLLSKAAPQLSSLRKIFKNAGLSGPDKKRNADAGTNSESERGMETGMLMPSYRNLDIQPLKFCQNHWFLICIEQDPKKTCRIAMSKNWFAGLRRKCPHM